MEGWRNTQFGKRRNYSSRGQADREAERDKEELGDVVGCHGSITRRNKVDKACDHKMDITLQNIERYELVKTRTMKQTCTGSTQILF